MMLLMVMRHDESKYDDSSALAFVPVRESLDRVMARLTGTGVSGVDVVLIWPEVVGQEIARNCTAIKFSRGALYLSVVEPRWASELHHLARVLIERLNAVVGSGVVCDIKVAVRRQ